MSIGFTVAGWTRRVIVLAVLCAGCAGDSTAPPPTIGAYKLTLYDGKALPVGLRNLVSIPANGGTGFTCNIRLTGATLSIDAGSNASSTDTLRTVCDDSRPDVTTTLSRSGSVSAIGDTTVITYPATPTQPTARTFARQSGTGLLVFRTETDMQLITSVGSSPGSAPATTILYDFTQRLYVP